MPSGRRSGFLSLSPSGRSPQERVTTCHYMVEELRERVIDFIFRLTGPIVYVLVGICSWGATWTEDGVCILRVAALSPEPEQCPKGSGADDVFPTAPAPAEPRRAAPRSPFGESEVGSNTGCSTSVGAFTCSAET